MIVTAHDFISETAICRHCGISEGYDAAYPQRCMPRVADEMCDGAQTVLPFTDDRREGHAMIVSGDAAASFNAVRLDSFENANRGVLVSANDETGEVVYKDATGEEKKLMLGDHAIKILPRR